MYGYVTVEMREKREDKRTSEHGRREKEEGKRKKEKGRREKEEGKRKKEKGRRKKEEGKRKKEKGRRKPSDVWVECWDAFEGVKRKAWRGVSDVLYCNPLCPEY
jgi:hypothetical protein